MMYDTPEERGSSNLLSKNPSSGLNPETLQQAITDAKEVRKNSLETAKKSLEESFSKKMSQTLTVEEKKNTIKQKEFSEENDYTTESDIDQIINEIEEEVINEVGTESSAAPHIPRNKNLEETKEMLKTFRKKVANYPKHLSYEGSMVLCVLLALNSTANAKIFNLPQIDQSLIKGLLPPKFTTYMDNFLVKFDDRKDFELLFENGLGEHYTMVMFNSVAHPRPEDLRDSSGGGIVPIERDGEKIAVGGKFHLNKRTIQKAIGTDAQESKYQEAEEKAYSPQQKQAGRNAYEIRADVLQMAIDWARTEWAGSTQRKPSDDDVISLAKKFYSFVENRR